MIDDERPEEQAAEEHAAEDQAAEEQAAEEHAAEGQAAEGEPTAEEAAPPAPEEEPTPAAEAEAEAEEPPADAEAPPAAEEPPADAEAPPAAEEERAPAAEAEPPPAAESAPAEARAKPEIPGADLEVDIVPEGFDPLAAEAARAELEEDAEPVAPAEPGEPQREALPQAAIDLAADARYTATGKRKTAIARVVLRPGSGAYAVNGRPLEEYFPRATSQRNIREPLENVGYETRMDVVASLHGGGIAAQAGALRHGIARALIEADPNLRVELKRRGFLTRDARVKERRKAGLKKARKRPQFSKR
jgi:small subunit ribosomal protein S9